jgi:hypothetical protein
MHLANPGRSSNAGRASGLYIGGIEPAGYLSSMTGSELRHIREAFGLSASEMGKALGYSGPRANIAVHIRRLEREARRIPPAVEKLVLMYARHGPPKE